MDPLRFDYPQLTPYNYAGNKPVTHIDIDGLQGTGDKKEGIINNEQSTSQQAGALPLVGGLAVTEKATETTLKVVFKKTAETGAKGSFTWANLLRGGLLTLISGVVVELFTSSNDQHTLEELKDLHFGDKVPEEYKNSTKSVELFLNSARQQGLFPLVNTDFAEEFDDDDGDNYEYFYRAVGRKELLATGGTLQHKSRENGDLRGEGPFVATNPAYVMNPRSFMYKGNNAKKYDFLVRYKMPKGTRQYLDDNSIMHPMDDIMNVAILTNKVIRKEEQKNNPILNSVNYGFPGTTGNSHFNRKIKNITIIPMSK